MDRTAVTDKIKDVIAGVTGIAKDTLADDVSLADDLALDSLSQLEIAVEIDYSFRLGLSDEAFRGVTGLPDMVDLVMARLAEREAETSAAGG